MKIKKKLGMFQVAMLWFDFTKEFGFKVHIFSAERATKFCEISTIDLSYVVTVKSTVEISQNFVAFLEYLYELYKKVLQRWYFKKKRYLIKILHAILYDTGVTRII